MSRTASLREEEALPSKICLCYKNWNYDTNSRFLEWLDLGKCNVTQKLSLAPLFEVHDNVKAGSPFPAHSNLFILLSKLFILFIITYLYLIVRCSWHESRQYDIICNEYSDWLLPRNVCQSTTDGTNDSNACTIIALSFGCINQQYSLTTRSLLGQHFNEQCQAALREAIRMVNVTISCLMGWKPGESFIIQCNAMTISLCDYFFIILFHSDWLSLVQIWQQNQNNFLSSAMSAKQTTHHWRPPGMLEQRQSRVPSSVRWGDSSPYAILHPYSGAIGALISWEQNQS